MAHAVSGLLAAILLSGVAAGPVAVYEPTLDVAAVAEAIRIGQSRIESIRVDYHRPYRIHVGRPPVDYLDLVTPFRRVELAAEERARLGDRRFGQREALAVLDAHGDRLQLFVELTFHPLNTYVGVPAYMVTLVRAGSPGIAGLEMARIPRFGARVSGTPLPYPAAPVLPSGSQPMLGGTLIVSFDNRQLDPRGVYDVVIEEAGKELARATVNLGTVR